MMRIKTLSFIVMAIVAMTMASCSDSATEKQLDGGWSCRVTETDEDGSSQLIQYDFILDESTHEARRFISIFYTPAMDDPDVSVEITGTWRATKEHIDFKWTFGDKRAKLFDLNSIGISDRAAWLAECDADDLRKALYEEIKKDFDGNESYKINSLTRDVLTISDDEQTLKLSRFEPVTEVEVVE